MKAESAQEIKIPQSVIESLAKATLKGMRKSPKSSERSTDDKALKKT